MNARISAVAAALILSVLMGSNARAQTVYSEDFTGPTTSNSWYFFSGACLTAGTAASSSPGSVPGCGSIKSSYYGENLVGGYNGAAGSAQTLPDPTGNGALRFTNGNPGGYNQRGAIVSANTFGTGAGVQITFKTVTYRGNSGGGGGDGADGISFYLMDGSQPAGVGAYGGSLGYTCSNANPPYDGLVGAYLGLGIDEYGNFLNQGDNTATGYGYQWNRIGLRGAGSISWAWLNSNYASYYPSSMNSGQRQAAVQKTCATGYLWNYSSDPVNGSAVVSAGSNVTIPDYAVIPNAYTVLSGVQIANESAMKRGDATPIFYNLKITQDGMLSLSYSLSGAAYLPIISNQSITASNGALPASFRFGFAGSTGGSTNIHEIMCFKAAPANQSGSSTSVNEKEAAKVETGTQAFFALYNSANWTGRLTANDLIDTNGIVTVSPLANWDASCVLTGTDSTGCASTGATGTAAAQAPSSRVMMTWNGSQGVPFQFASLASGQQTTLDLGDASPTANRLNYLRGVRTNEVNTAGVGLYRARDGILGDIIDSSPAFVGPPSSGYTSTWVDRLYSTATAPETDYLAFVTAQQTRLNVVYTGANDGFLHGFRTGCFDSSGTFHSTCGASNTPSNDGLEVLAYMPGSSLQSSSTASNLGVCPGGAVASTGSVVQNIHGVTPLVATTTPACVNPTLDYSSTQYGHNFFVDAPPGTGDLFYRDAQYPSGAWHTWVVGGLGAGGAAIYALDVTNPDPTNLAESNAAKVVIGEWNSSTISCSALPACGTNLGNTYGIPQIRRFHNGAWGMVFGNGLNSATGDAGIFVMTIDPTSGVKTFYYFTTGSGTLLSPGTSGVAYATPVDLDGDHITDYVYAGDVLGNVWRFDLTNKNPSNWGTAFKVFSTGGQPIVSKLVVVAALTTSTAPRVMVEFGTGQKTQVTNTSAATYSSGTQDLYGIWDWNMSSWNALGSSVFDSMAAGSTGLTAPYTLVKSKLTQQSFTVNATTLVRSGSSNTVCWKDGSSCSVNDKFGWYADLPGGSEQVIYNPIFYQGAFLVNSTVPANNIPTACEIVTDTGFTYAISAATGGTFTNVFPNRNDTLNNANVAGVETDATGSPYVVTTAEGTINLVYQTVKGIPGSDKANLPSNVKATRLTWVELR